MKLAGPLTAASVLALAAGAQGAQPQSVTGPVAEYWMDVSTSTGLGGMLGGAAAGGGRPSVSSLAGILGGAMNPDAVSHSLGLSLGSSRTAAAPAAAHAPPAALGVGASLPLVTPQRAAPAPATPSQPGSLEEYRAQRPQGKMLIYWGCGEHAPAGQPITIDFAQLGADAQGLAQLSQAFKPFTTTPETPPSPSRNATYGAWPNTQSSTAVPATGSLVGEHAVRGNYSPDIRFSLGAGQDFMGPMTLTTNSRAASGATNLGWSPVSGAKAYLATLIGAAGAGANSATIVMWSSSQAQVFAFAAPQYLSNGDIDRLVASHHLMDANATSCTVPAEIGAQVQGGLVNMTAFGGEADFSDPPRPAAPAPWNISWTVKVRYRSATSALLGQSLGGPAGGRAGAVPPAAGRAGAPATGSASAPPPQTPASGAGAAAGRAAAGALLRGLGF